MVLKMVTKRVSRLTASKVKVATQIVKQLVPRNREIVKMVRTVKVEAKVTTPTLIGPKFFHVIIAGPRDIRPLIVHTPVRKNLAILT